MIKLQTALPTRLSAWGFMLAALAALPGCGDPVSGEGDVTQVAATVNDQEISVPQLQHVVQRQAQGSKDRSDAVVRQVLSVIVDQELAAQAAREQGLERDPRVIQAAEAAKREVLAKAYQEVLAERAAYPSSDEVDAYYENHPALFSQRRFFQLREVSVAGTEEAMRAVQQQVEATSHPSEAMVAVQASGLQSSVREFTVAPEDVPLLLLERLAKLKDGQSLMVPRPGNGRVLTLLSARQAPLSRDAARASIQAFLLNERRGQAIQDGLKALRSSARIEIKERFAQAAPSGPAASAPN